METKTTTITLEELNEALKTANKHFKANPTTNMITYILENRETLNIQKNRICITSVV